MLGSRSLSHEHVNKNNLWHSSLQAALDLRRQQRHRAPAARSATVCKAAAAQVAEESPEAVAHQKNVRGSPSKVSTLRRAQDHDLLHQEARGVGPPISQPGRFA